MNLQTLSPFGVFIAAFAFRKILHTSSFREEDLNHKSATFYSQIWYLLNWDNVLPSSPNQVPISILLRLPEVTEEPKILYQKKVK